MQFKVRPAQNRQKPCFHGGPPGKKEEEKEEIKEGSVGEDTSGKKSSLKPFKRRKNQGVCLDLARFKKYTYTIHQAIAINQINHRQFNLIYIPYSSTDNFGPSIPVSDRLIFCCGNLILHQKKKLK